MNKEAIEITTPAPLKIPKIKAESETQTSGQLVITTPVKKTNEDMELPQNLSIKKRRNLSKNRGQATRNREKTPEPGRTPIPHDDTTTSDDEDFGPHRTSREIDADNSYEEMKRLVSARSTVKDPVYDLDVEEVRVARVAAANERRRRSISPFALPDKEELKLLERKGSFIDPTNKLLSTTYCLSPKDEDTGRRNSLTIEPFRNRENSLTPPVTASPVDKLGFSFPSPTTPKKQDEIIYPDEATRKAQTKALSPSKTNKAEVFTFDKIEEKPTKTILKASTPKPPETEAGELNTKVIQVERTPSKKLLQENKPTVEVRQRVVRTPSRKSIVEMKPIIVRQPAKPVNKEEVQSKVPPEKPVRSKSATRFGGKTSESEMSEDQGRQLNTEAVTAPKRKVVPTPRRFLKNRSPRANRSQSVNRVEDLADKTATVMSQTSREIIELMQQARARSLSIPKDDPKLLKEYIKYNNNKALMTPNKTPSTPKKSSRGVSCPKTIQIISDKEILAGLTPIKKLDLEFENRGRRSTYIDASQSEYTSSCYSSSPSENEHTFDLSERTAELSRKLKILSQQVHNHEANILLSNECMPQIQKENIKSVLRKRPVVGKVADQNGVKKEVIKPINGENKALPEKKKKPEKPETKSKWRIIRVKDNWKQHLRDHKNEYSSIKSLMNRCLCDLVLLIVVCGLGGMMFKMLEGSFENAYKCSTRNVKRDFIEHLWRSSNYMREEDWKSLARTKLFEFENQLHTAHEAGVTSYSGQRSWNFMNSFVYCLTLVTTIGYGHIAPKTTSGRVATILYAIVGIPLFLIVLADFGKLFTRIIKFFWSFIRRFYYTRSCRKVRGTVQVQEVMKGLNIVYDAVRRPSQIMFEGETDAKNEDGTERAPTLQRKPSADVPPPLPPKPGSLFVVDPEVETDLETPAPSLYEIDDEFNLPISVAIFILIVYIIIGAVAYNIWEEWDFFESFYFVFISMSTIGLGDLVPDHPMFMMASILYLVFGLALTSMCINVVQVKLSNTFKQASAKLGATIGLKVAEEDGSLVPITPPPTEIVPVHMPKKVDEPGDDETINTTEIESIVPVYMPKKVDETGDDETINKDTTEIESTDSKNR